MPADEGNDTPSGQAEGSPPSRGAGSRFAEFARRESELMERLAAARKRKISSLARELVVETIDQVQRLIEERPDRNCDS